MSPRLTRLQVLLDAQGLDGLLISHQPNIFYLTGYASRESYLLVAPKKTFFITDFRYLEEAKSCLKNIQTAPTNGSLFRTLAGLCAEVKIRRLGFEAKNLNFAEYQKFKEELKKIRVNLAPTFDVIEDFRKVKDASEINKIKAAARIAIGAHRHVLQIAKPGASEREIAARLEAFMRLSGAQKAGFDIIVACGAHSSLPHALAKDTFIAKDKPLLVDLGAIYRGYNSDLTRVFFLGKMSDTFQRVYSIVKEAQLRAIRRIVPGVACQEIDAAARNYIRSQGFGANFGHSLGHGLGLEVHEEPRINAKNEALLEEGTVFTVEPAI